jgi:ankyrin repeat protein
MNLEQQKKRARDLLRAIRSGDAESAALLRRLSRRWQEVDDGTLRQQAALHDVLLALARDQGFASWAKLKAYAEPPARSGASRLFVADVRWIDERVEGLMRARQSAGPAALDQIREWHPRFSGLSDEEIRQAPFSADDARLVYAREHGFDTWPDLVDRVNALSRMAAEDLPAAEPFMAAFSCLQQGDSASLARWLRDHPDLAYARGTNGNTLLNLGTSLAARLGAGVGTAMIAALIDAGAEPNEANDRGWTPLHQAGYSNQPEIAAQLIAAGAELDAEGHGAGGTPLIVALFWGHREVAEVLARHSTAPGNLRTAAGLGRGPLMDGCFDHGGALTPEACAARGFYRPHSGFPDWQPSNDRQEILDEALVWACKSNRVEVLPRIVQAGAHLDADPYRGTALIWAAVCNRLAAAAWLLDHGAGVNRRATFGGLTHGQGVTALHIASQRGHLAMVKLLVARGADPTLRDDLYSSDAAGTASYFGQEPVRDFLRSLGTAQPR